MKRLFYKIFKRYRRLEFAALSYSEADKLFRENPGKQECDQWVLAKEEDSNRSFGVVVFMERRERITH